jgi:hypothetical protein
MEADAIHMSLQSPKATGTPVANSLGELWVMQVVSRDVIWVLAKLVSFFEVMRRSVPSKLVGQPVQCTPDPGGNCIGIGYRALQAGELTLRNELSVHYSTTKYIAAHHAIENGGDPTGHPPYSIRSYLCSLSIGADARLLDKRMSGCSPISESTTLSIVPFGVAILFAGDSGSGRRSCNASG